MAVPYFRSTFRPQTFCPHCDSAISDLDYHRPDSSDPENKSGPNDNRDNFDFQQHTPEHPAATRSKSLSNSRTGTMTSVFAIGVGVAAAAFLVSNIALGHSLQVDTG